METEQRSRILVAAPREALDNWVKRIRAQGEVRLIKPARPGLVMMQARETVQQELFYVGEIYVYESMASVDGELGYGVVMGNDPERADHLAVLDAVFHSKEEKWKSFVRELDAWLLLEQERQEVSWRREFSLIRRSRVDFEMMDREED